MALSDYREPLETVTFTGGSFSVRGLSLKRILPLVRDHGAAIAALIGKGKELYAQQDAHGLTSLGAVALTSAPEFVADVIATSLADPDDTSVSEADKVLMASELPAPVQIDALAKIYTLTMVVEGGLGNLLATINMALSSLSQEIAASALPKMN